MRRSAAVAALSLTVLPPFAAAPAAAAVRACSEVLQLDGSAMHLEFTRGRVTLVDPGRGERDLGVVTPTWLAAVVDGVAERPGDGLLYGVAELPGGAEVVAVDPGERAVRRTGVPLPGKRYGSVEFADDGTLRLVGRGDDGRVAVLLVGVDGVHGVIRESVVDCTDHRPPTTTPRPTTPGPTTPTAPVTTTSPAAVRPGTEPPPAAVAPRGEQPPPAPALAVPPRSAPAAPPATRNAEPAAEPPRPGRPLPGRQRRAIQRDEVIELPAFLSSGDKRRWSLVVLLLVLAGGVATARRVHRS
jgi:hypothetical protein